MSGLQPETRREYGILFDVYARWCKENGECAFPTTEGALVGFITGRSAVKRGTLKGYVTAVCSVHRLGLEAVPAHGRGSWLDYILRGRGERDFKNTKDEESRKAIPAAGVKAVLLKALEPTATADFIRGAAALGVGFLFFARAGTVGKLGTSQLTWDESNLLLKADEKHHAGTLKRKREVLAPRRAPGVDLLVRVLTRWRSIRAPAAKTFFDKPGAAPLTSQELGRIYRSVLAEVGCIATPPTWFGSHSVRGGGASACAAIGVAEVEIHVWGGWSLKSSEVRKVYIDPSIRACQAAVDFFYWKTAECRQRCGGFTLY